MRGPILGLSLLASVGCGGEVLEPVLPVHAFYEAVAADGRPLPVSRFSVVSNAAGSCESDLIGVSIRITEDTYNLTVAVDRRCSGIPGFERIYSQSKGEVISSGRSGLIFTPTTPAEYRIVEATLSTSGLSAALQRGSSTHELQFEMN